MSFESPRIEEQKRRLYEIVPNFYRDSDVSSPQALKSFLYSMARVFEGLRNLTENFETTIEPRRMRIDLLAYYAKNFGYEIDREDLDKQRAFVDLALQYTGIKGIPDSFRALMRSYGFSADVIELYFSQFMYGAKTDGNLHLTAGSNKIKQKRMESVGIEFEVITPPNAPQYLMGYVMLYYDFYSPYGKQMLSIYGTTYDDDGDWLIKYAGIDGSSHIMVYLDKPKPIAEGTTSVNAKFVDMKRKWLNVSESGKEYPGSMWIGDTIRIKSGGANDGDYVITDLRFDLGDGLPIAVVDSVMAADEDVLSGELPVLSDVPIKSNSSSTVSLGVGNKALTIGTGLSLGQKKTVHIIHDSGNRMIGDLVSYDDMTGDLVVDVYNVFGQFGDSFSTWTVIFYVTSQYEIIPQNIRVGKYNDPYLLYNDVLLFDEAVDNPLVSITNRFMVRFDVLPLIGALTDQLLDRMKRRIVAMKPINSEFEGFCYRLSYTDKNKIPLTVQDFDSAVEMSVGTKMSGKVSFNGTIPADIRKITGYDTSFTTEISGGDVIMIGVDDDFLRYAVVDYVVSETELILKDDLPVENHSSDRLDIAKRVYGKRVLKEQEGDENIRYLLRSNMPSSDFQNGALFDCPSGITDEVTMVGVTSVQYNSETKKWGSDDYTEPLFSRLVEPSFVKIDRLMIFCVFEIDRITTLPLLLNEVVSGNVIYGGLSYFSTIGVGSSSGKDILLHEAAVGSDPNFIEWEKVYTAGEVLNSISYGIVSGNRIFVVVGENGFIATSPDGRNWTTRTSGTSEDLYKVRYVSGYGVQRFVAVGSNGTALHSSDGGVTWNVLGTVPVSGDLVAVCGMSVTYIGTPHVWVYAVTEPVGSDTIVIRIDLLDGLPSWSTISTIFESNKINDMVAVTTYWFWGVVMVGDGGIIWNTRNYVDFSKVASGVTDDLISVKMNPRPPITVVEYGSATAVGANGTVLRLIYNAAIHNSEWKKVEVGVTYELLCILFYGYAYNQIVVGNGNFVMKDEFGSETGWIWSKWLKIKAYAH